MSDWMKEHTDRPNERERERERGKDFKIGLRMH